MPLLTAFPGRPPFGRDIRAFAKLREDRYHDPRIRRVIRSLRRIVETSSDNPEAVWFLHQLLRVN